MNEERIQIRVTASGQTLDVVVLSKHLDRIQVVLGEGKASRACGVTSCRPEVAQPTSATRWGEIVYERSRKK